THGLGHADSVPPVLGGDAGWVHLSANHLKWFTVQQELGIVGTAEGERVRFAVRNGRRRNGDTRPGKTKQQERCVVTKAIHSTPVLNRSLATAQIARLQSSPVDVRTGHD